MKLTGDVFMPSLQHIAFSRISIALWNQHHIKLSLAKYVASPVFLEQYVQTPEWLALIAKVIENAQKLPLPESLKQELTKCVRGVSWQIVVWYYCHDDLYYNDSKLTDLFCWTPLGTIDYGKVAEVLVQDQNLPICKRYALSCIYCFEDSIYSLRNTVGYRILDRKLVHLKIENKKPLLDLWSDFIGGKFLLKIRTVHHFDQPGSVYFAHCGFKIATDVGIVEAMKFFYRRLAAGEPELNLVETAKVLARKTRTDFSSVFSANALCFLLSIMDEDEQMELFKRDWFGVISILLVWPWHESFIKIVECLRGSFSNEDYYALLNLIIDRATQVLLDYDYVKLFTKYWHEISVDCKRYYVSKAIEKNRFLKLLNIADQRLTTSVLKYASASQKEEIIFGGGYQNVCLMLIHSNNWNILECLLGECLHSMDEVASKIVQLKEELEWYERTHFVTSKAGEPIWCNFFKLLDEFNNQNNTRTEEDDPSAKKIRQTL